MSHTGVDKVPETSSDMAEKKVAWCSLHASKYSSDILFHNPCSFFPSDNCLSELCCSFWGIYFLVGPILIKLNLVWSPHNGAGGVDLKLWCVQSTLMQLSGTWLTCIQRLQSDNLIRLLGEGWCCLNGSQFETDAMRKVEWVCGAADAAAARGSLAKQQLDPAPTPPWAKTVHCALCSVLYTVHCTHSKLFTLWCEQWTVPSPTCT